MINKLIAKDFMGYAEKEFNFAPGVNIVTGANHSGKSSVKQGIRYTLTAIPDKKEVEEIIRLADGVKCSATAITNFEGQAHTIEREAKPHKLRLNGVKLEVGRGKEKDGLSEYGYKRNVIQMLCDASNFFELTAKEQADLLMNYFSGDDEIDVVAYGMDIEDAKDFVGLRAANIKPMAENFREIRKSVNKNIDQVKAEIEIINRDSRQIIVDKTEAELLNEKTIVEAKLKLVLTPGKTPDKPIRLIELIDQKKTLELSSYKADQRITSRMVEIVAKGKANAEIINGYKSGGGKCPLSNGQVECKESGLAAFIARLESETETLRKEYCDLNAIETAALAKYKIDREAKLKELEAAIIAETAAYEKAVAEVEAKNKQAQTENNELRVKLNGIEMSIHELHRRAAVQKKGIDLSAEVLKLEENSKRYDRYIKFLESDLKEKIISGNSRGLFDMVNDVSKVFGFSIAAPDGDLTNIRINGKTPGMLSTSERILCGIALQLAIAKLSGYKFIVVDDMESVYLPYMQTLLRILSEEFSDITSILIGLEAAFTSKAIGKTTIQNFYNLSTAEKPEMKEAA